MTQVILYYPDDDRLVSGGLECIPAWQESDDALLWLSLDEVVLDEEKNMLADVFNLHPLAVADALNDRHPPKLEAFDDYSLMLFRGLAADPDRFELETITIAAIVGARYLITRHSGRSLSIERMREEVEENHGLLRRGPDALAIRLSRIMVERYLKLFLNLEERMEEIEQEMLTDPSDETLAELIGYKTELIKYRRIFHYHVRILEVMKRGAPQGFSKQNKTYAVDSYEQQERADSLAALYYEMASGLIDGYISVASHRLNNIMKILTIVSVIFVPLSFLAGLYGMNFEGMPEYRVPGAYYILLGIMLTITIALLVFFRKKKWL